MYGQISQILGYVPGGGVGGVVGLVLAFLLESSLEAAGLLILMGSLIGIAGTWVYTKYDERKPSTPTQ